MARRKATTRSSQATGGKDLIIRNGIPIPRPAIGAKRPPTSASSSTALRGLHRGTSNTGGVKKPRRFRAGVSSLREIRRIQKETNLIISKAGFRRLVRSVQDTGRDYMRGMGGGVPGSGDRHTGFRWQASAIDALQEAAETMLTSTFEMCVLCAIHARRVTVMPKDLALVRQFAIPGRIMPPPVGNWNAFQNPAYNYTQPEGKRLVGERLGSRKTTTASKTPVFTTQHRLRSGVDSSG